MNSEKLHLVPLKKYRFKFIAYLAWEEHDSRIKIITSPKIQEQKFITNKLII